jgi:hypothetical protein
MMRQLRFRVIKKNGPIMVGDTTLRQLEVDMDTLRIVHVRSDGPDVVNNLRPFYTAAERPRMVFIQTGTDEDLEVYEEIPEGGRVVHEETPEVEVPGRPGSV